MKKSLKIIALIFSVIVLILSVKSAIVLKSVLDNQQVLELISSTDRIILIVNLISSFIVIVLLAVIVVSNFSSKKDNRIIMDYDKSNSPKRPQKKQSKSAKNREMQERIEYKNNVLQKLNIGIDDAKDINEFTEKILSNIAEEYDVMQGLFFVRDSESNKFTKKGNYAFYSEDDIKEFAEDEGLSGQVASSRKLLNISEMPENYITVLSGLGQASPTNLMILPVIYKNKSIGIVELASFSKLDSNVEDILMSYFKQIADKLNKFAEQ